MITDYEADILRHTRNNGRFVTDDRRVIEMSERGMLLDFGPWSVAGGMHFLKITKKGRAALNEWESAQPKPKVKKRRVSRQFRAWRDYESANGRLGFSKFLKQVWPECKHWEAYR